MLCWLRIVPGAACGLQELLGPSPDPNPYEIVDTAAYLLGNRQVVPPILTHLANTLRRRTRSR